MKRLLTLICLVCIFGSCTNNSEKEAQRRTIDSLKFVLAKQAIIDSMNALKPTSRTTGPRSSSRTLNNKQKGAIIGGAAGAVVGSATARNSTVGALVGGTAGALIGADVGARHDKKKKKN